MRLKRVMDWPLRVKIAALLVVASVLPLAVLTAWDIRDSRKDSVSHAEALLAARGDQLAGEIDMFNRGYLSSAVRFSHLPKIVAYCSAPETANSFESIAHSILEVQPAVDPNVRGAAILDLHGRVRLATEAVMVGQDLSPRSHVREALRGVPVVSDIYIGGPEVGNVATIDYLAPVRGPDGALIGVLALSVRATAVWTLAKTWNALAGPRSFAVLFDSHGIRIAHTYSDEIVFHPAGALSVSTIDALVAERRLGARTRELLNDVRPFSHQFESARAAAPDHSAFRGFAPVNQTWNYGVGRRLKTVKWTVFYMIPQASIDTPITKTTNGKIVFAGLIMLAALLAGVLFASVILGPIRALMKATELVAAGDLTARVERQRTDELGRLGTSFNSMVTKIETQTAALEHAQTAMQRAQRATDTASDELKTFSYSVAHDLRAPLRGMNGFSQILLDEYEDKLDDEGKECLQQIQQSSVRMANLIDALLALARVSRSELKVELIDLTAVAHSIVARLAGANPDRTVEVTVADRLHASMDPQLARTLVENLLGNAWKFTSKLQVSRIELGCATTDAVPTFFVRDNGAGFDMAHATKLFAPFQRLHAVNEFSGAGIGLATAQRIVHRYGGRIWADSGVDAGATFYFTLASS